MGLKSNAWIVRLQDGTDAAAGIQVEQHTSSGAGAGEVVGVTVAAGVDVVGAVDGDQRKNASGRA